VVYLHAMVRDEHGAKMSKTKGNVIDPLEVSRDMGADSLRFTLANLAGQARDIKLSLKSVETSRNFINKVWNASRFGLMNLADFPADGPPPERLGVVDRWILSRLDRAIEGVTSALEAFQIDKAANAAYEFFWNELCDWYIELAKPLLYGDAGPAEKHAAQWTLVQCLDTALRLLHPFIPFASEEIWQKLPLAEGRAQSLMVADFPRVGAFTRDADAEREVGLLLDTINAVRTIRGELTIPAGSTLEAIVIAPDAETAALLAGQDARITKLARIERVTLQVGGERPKGAALQVAGPLEVLVPVAGLIDTQAELSRLDKTSPRPRRA
jgi:valyl-tRNA synthetase